MIHKHITIIQNTILTSVIIISYILYFLIAFGLSTFAPQYLVTLQYWTKIYISLFLIYRFNFFRKVEFIDLDRKIAFIAGIFLLTTTIVDQLIKYVPYAEKIYVIPSPNNSKSLYKA